MSSEEDLLRKVSALLAKAEGTDNEHEASAFFEKAHELMVRYAIDEARVRAEQKRINGRRLEEPVVEDYMFSSYAHHATAKEDLLAMVGKAHSVHSIPYGNSKGDHLYGPRAEANRGLKESKWTRLVGYKEDIEHVKLLYLSLLIQSQRFATEDWRHRYGDGKHSAEGLGKFTWMSAHMEGFAHRIGERFRELTAVIYQSVNDGQSLIVDKDANILEWMYEHGLMARPISYCYATGWPDWFKAKSNSKKWYCFRRKGHDTSIDPPPTEHYFQKPVYSYSTAVGRRSSGEGRSVGREAANRADIGLTRVSSTPALKG